MLQIDGLSAVANNMLFECRPHEKVVDCFHPLLEQYLKRIQFIPCSDSWNLITALKTVWSMQGISFFSKENNDEQRKFTKRQKKSCDDKCEAHTRDAGHSSSSDSCQESEQNELFVDNMELSQNFSFTAFDGSGTHLQLDSDQKQSTLISVDSNVSVDVKPLPPFDVSSESEHLSPRDITSAHLLSDFSEMAPADIIPTSSSVSSTEPQTIEDSSALQLLLNSKQSEMPSTVPFSVVVIDNIDSILSLLSDTQSGAAVLHKVQHLLLETAQRANCMVLTSTHFSEFQGTVKIRPTPLWHSAVQTRYLITSATVVNEATRQQALTTQQKISTSQSEGKAKKVQISMTLVKSSDKPTPQVFTISLPIPQS
eukprot:MONOS_152.1-p1 / transcript=MONOS_152.1 / gene=MONOS_152 / organism=Monocercomonoides_exilis_PA203 / gene_product=unspecified product / transcript_product=unspecified product / location=Mono_scaffold00003:38305-39634(+) / protein_length=368 / sequence_SO=supercontig / SO=protein_coding / is_pseudo=false